jgi:hypothetical protein
MNVVNPLRPAQSREAVAPHGGAVQLAAVSYGSAKAAQGTAEATPCPHLRPRNITQCALNELVAESGQRL